MGCLTTKASGSIASFMSPSVTNIKSLKVHFSPKQLGTGDPSPENVREIVGWDGVEADEYNSDFKFIPIVKSSTYLGVTWTINDSGLVIAEGTPTSWSNCLIGYIKVNGDETIQGFIYGSLNNVTISKPKLYDSDDKEISFSASDNILLHGLDLSQYKDVKKVGIVLKRNTNNIYMSGSCYVVVKKIENINNIHKTTIPINWTKNIKQWTYTDTTIDDSYSSNNFNGYGNGRWDNVIVDIPNEWFGKELTYSAYIERSSSPLNEYDDVRVWCYGDSTTLFDAKTAQRIYTAEESGRSWVTFTIPEGTTKIGLGLYLSKGSRAYNPQLEYGSEPTEYQPYIGTVYGGYIDLISGELVENIVFIELDGSENWRVAGNTYAYVFGYPNCIFGSSSWKRHKSSHWENVQYGNANDIAINSNGAITIGVDFFNAVGLEFTASALKEYLAGQKANGTPLQITSPLADSIAHQLTPTQLKSFVGQNNFWSNADYVEVEYDLIETFDIQKAKRKIIMNQPHVETLTGDAVSFTTDMKAPLKECKVSFMPVQEGSGDPSPTNVRNITGWNGVSVKNGENTYSIDWTDNAGTVYGGYVDLVSGVLTATVKCIDMGTGDWHYATQTSVQHFYCFLDDKLYSQNEYIPCWCSCYNFWGNGISSVIYSGFADKEFGAQVTNGMIRLRDDSITDVTTFKESVSGQTLAYPLREPITYQLTPEQILSLKGINNFSCGIKNDMNIKYWKHKLSDSANIAYEAENLIFDGTNYIDTGVYLFSEKNINRDFEVVIEDLYGGNSSNNTIVCAKYNGTAIGFLIRLNSADYTRYNGTISMKINNHNNITIKRVNGIITMNGEVITNPTVQFTNTVHNHPLVLGCALQDNGTPYRYATGTIGHITVKWL